MTGVLSSRELGARASGAHSAGTIAGGRCQEQAPAPGGIHGRPEQMIEHITHTWCQPRVYQRV